MLFVKMQNGLPIEVSDNITNEQHHDSAWQSRWDWKTFEVVEILAKQLCDMTGDVYLPVDNTAAVSPRYEVIKAPKIGDPVSYGFNGDYYPDGTVVKITPTYRITTSTGHVYRRKGLRGCWLQKGGTWGLVQGHHYEQNPHF